MQSGRPAHFLSSLPLSFSARGPCPCPSAARVCPLPFFPSSPVRPRHPFFSAALSSLSPHGSHAQRCPSPPSAPRLPRRHHHPLHYASVPSPHPGHAHEPLTVSCRHARRFPHCRPPFSSPSTAIRGLGPSLTSCTLPFLSRTAPLPPLSLLPPSACELPLPPPCHSGYPTKLWPRRPHHDVSLLPTNPPSGLIGKPRAELAGVPLFRASGRSRHHRCHCFLKASPVDSALWEHLNDVLNSLQLPAEPPLARAPPSTTTSPCHHRPSPPARLGAPRSPPMLPSASTRRKHPILATTSSSPTASRRQLHRPYAASSSSVPGA